jgi:hypothetical protein
MSARLQCLVPFCRRSSRNPKGYAEWICGKHWRLAPRGLRATYHRARRRERGTLAALAWRKLKRVVTERAMGI